MLRSTTISIRSAISSLARFTNKDEPRCEGAERRHRAPQRTRHRYRAAIAGPDEDCAIYRQPCHTIRATLQGFLQSPRRPGKGGVRSGLQPAAIDAASTEGCEP